MPSAPLPMVSNDGCVNKMKTFFVVWVLSQIIFCSNLTTKQDRNTNSYQFCVFYEFF